jgi:putative transposase
MEKCYATDLTDAEWNVLEPYVPDPDKRGRPRIHSPREILDAVFYVLKSGCPWRLLPKDFPPWETVYWWFARWRSDGTFERLNTALRERLRTRLGRDSRYLARPSPTPKRLRPAGWAASRGDTTATRRSEAESGTYSLTRRAWCSKPSVHSAKVPEQDGLRLLLQSVRTGLSRLKHLWLDAGYEGRGRRWAEEEMGLSVEIVRKPPKPVPEKAAMIWAKEWAKEGKKIDWQSFMPPRGYVAQPRRWVVERTFSWLGQNRRMSKDYERLCASAEAFVYAAMIRLMVRRLARS